MNTVYLSGPISDLDFEVAKANFARAEQALIAKGYKVFNPITVAPKRKEGMSEEKHWFECMLNCLPALNVCTHICCVHFEIPKDKTSVFSYGKEVEHLFAERMKLKLMLEHQLADNTFTFVVNN